MNPIANRISYYRDGFALVSALRRTDYPEAIEMADRMRKVLIQNLGTDLIVGPVLVTFLVWTVVLIVWGP